MKCKKGFKQLKGRCVNKKEIKIFGNLTDEFQILKIALIGAITSVAGWAIFKSLVDIFKLESLNSWIMLVVGIVMILATYKLGWEKLLKN